MDLTDYTRIRKYGFAFEGKKVFIKEAAGVNQKDD